MAKITIFYLNFSIFTHPCKGDFCEIAKKNCQCIPMYFGMVY